jgi:hypothetical protein
MWHCHGYYYPWRLGLSGHWCTPTFSWPWTPPSKEQEVAILEEQARILENELDSIKKRLEEIKT